MNLLDEVIEDMKKQFPDEIKNGESYQHEWLLKLIKFRSEMMMKEEFILNRLDRLSDKINKLITKPINNAS